MSSRMSQPTESSDVKKPSVPKGSNNGASPLALGYSRPAPSGRATAVRDCHRVEGESLVEKLLEKGLDRLENWFYHKVLLSVMLSWSEA